MATRGELLGRTLLFAEVHPTHREQIAAAMEEKAFSPGEAIVKQGAPGDALFVIVAGRVSVTAASEDVGFAFELAKLEPGDHFGEMSLLTEEPRSATVTALEPTTVLALAKPVFERIAGQLPQVSAAIARSVARRLSQMDRERGIPFVSLQRQTLSADLYAMAPEEVWTRGRMAPVSLEGRTLTVAMVDPTDALALDELRRCAPGVTVRPVAAAREDLERFVAHGRAPAAAPAARSQSVAPSAVGAVRARPQDIAFLTATEEREDRPGAPATDAVLLFAQIVSEALGLGASDIHIEADRSGVAVRHRVEGTLRRSQMSIPRSALRPLVARIKVLAGLDIAESRAPQHGRIGTAVGGRDYDLRVATVPARLGEKVAIRILDVATAIQPLDGLVLASKMATALRKCIFRPYGAVLITGPTGCGKTTTMYSALAERTSQGAQLNVMTAEDPVEYNLPGITQVQINEAVGLTYPEALRAFLRQDPDIVVVGETRDAATARIALEASLTGHLVLTTLHTNDALSTVVRLRQMDLDPYLLANAVLCVVAQRLVRRLCPACRRPGQYMPAVFENLRAAGVLREGEEIQFQEAAGCERCNGTGYRGRVGIFEMLLFDEQVREAVSQDVPLARIRGLLEGKGYVGLGRYANFLLKSGLTVPGEVLRAVRIEQTLGSGVPT